MSRTVHTNDYDVRALVVRTLLDASIPRDAIRHEITLDTSSSDGRADIVLAFDDRLVGIEIKSGKDTLTRLSEQGPRYAARFDRLVLVAGERHLPALDSLSGNGFGAAARLFVRRGIDGSLNLSERYPRENVIPILTQNSATYNSRSHRTSPYAMMELLWQKEASAVTGHRTRLDAIRLGADLLALRDLRKSVAAKLRARQLNRWEEAFWSRFDAPSLEIAA